MRIVVIESPYAAPTPEGIELNVNYLRACIRDALQRGEAPFASHALYTQPGILRDGVPEERELGMRAGWEFHRIADAVVVYEDLGISSGMKGGITRANKLGKLVEFRKLGVEFKITSKRESGITTTVIDFEDALGPLGRHSSETAGQANARLDASLSAQRIPWCVCGHLEVEHTDGSCSVLGCTCGSASCAHNGFMNRSHANARSSKR